MSTSYRYRMSTSNRYRISTSNLYRCVQEERDWKVLNLVLTEIPSVLQNKGMLVR